MPPAQRLRLVATHVWPSSSSRSDSPRSSAPATDTVRCRDIYSNTWTLDTSGQHLSVCPGACTLPVTAAVTTQPVALPDGVAAASMLAADDDGYIWLSDRANSRSIYRLNPRGPHYAAEDGGSPSKAGGLFRSTDSTGVPPKMVLTHGQHTRWRAFNSDAVLLGGTVKSLESSQNGSHNHVVVTIVTSSADPQQFELHMDSTFCSFAEPFDHSDHDSVGKGSRRWTAIDGGRLPCGNHDIYAAECGGKLYVAGGQLWYAGFPAQMCEFDQLWELDPAKLKQGVGVTGAAWSIVPARMPALNLGERAFPHFMRPF
jgi:hypothetical protein